MKRIFKNLMFGLLLCSGAAMSSCSADSDELLDSIPYSRILTPMSFKAETVASVGTDIEFTWSNVQNAVGYQLEIFEAVVETIVDENNKEVEIVMAPDYETAVPIITRDDLTSASYLAQSLEVDKSFYARVRGLGNKQKGIEDSHWAYLEDAVSTSAVRASLNPFIVERTENSVTVGWDAADDAADLTSIRIETIEDTGEALRVIALSDANIEACAITVADLTSCTNYKFTLLFGKAGQRGAVTAWTRTATDGSFVEINSVDGLYNALKDATSPVKIKLAYSEQPYDLKELNSTATFEFATDLTIIGMSTDEGKQPVIANTNFVAKDGATLIHLEDIVLDGGLAAGSALTMSSTTVKTVEYLNVELCNFTKAIYDSNTAGTKVDELTFNGVYAHDINASGGEGGDFIDVRNGAIGTLIIKNSTFYACARTFLRFGTNEGAGRELNKVEVTNCTFNYVTATNSSSNNAGIFNLRQVSGTSLNLGSFKMSNCLFMNIYNPNETKDSFWCRICRDSAESIVPDCSKNYYYHAGNVYAYGENDKNVKYNGVSTFFNQTGLTLEGVPFSQELGLANGGLILEEDPCTNSEAGRHYLKPGSQVAANKVGDPRWWTATEQVVVRATALEVVTEPTVWNFTEKAKWLTESITANTIIENIRIYAPAEVTMGEGLAFLQTAEVSGDAPTSSALEFIAEGVGSVKVVATGSASASVQVMAGGDVYTVRADGTEHTVVFGDLVGENHIYVMAGGPVKFTKVEWSDNLEADKTTSALATPKLTVTPGAVTEGNEENEEIVVSWEAVANAYDYVVTFDGVETETTELSYTISAEVLAELTAGDYSLTVVARPVSTSTKYTNSAEATANFIVESVAFPESKDWVFAEWPYFETFFDQVPSDGKTFNYPSPDGLTISNTGATGGIKGKDSTFAKGYIDNNGSATKGKGQLCFSFELPEGTWVISADVKRNASDQTGYDMYLEVGDNDTNPTIVSAPYDEVTKMSFPAITLSAPTTVHVYAMGRMHFYGIHYEMAEAEPVSSWIFSECTWLEEFMTTITGMNDREFKLTYDGLTLINEGSGGIKSNTASKGFIDNNGDSAKGPKQLRFEFVVPAGKWNVSVYAKKNSAAEEGTLRLGLGEYSATNTEKTIATSADLEWNTFETIEVAEKTKVYVYAYYRTHFYGLKWEAAE